ncbi:hypothetical protein P6F15_03415 [Thiopseudomonas alkaliphila]|uniref:Oxygen-independent coproporphyrinogen III oxidase n=1 Tax=Thiopseudomonas alkaliphila TaxID=1697053 RepID=A0A0K1XCD5_9GAMM|nr:hypothetical protein [Thiopseudomonas alkaliphila]AKX58991.1 hypothetical protein AKN88_02840 [Thiopseudomonas alkaliphila]
MQSLFSWMTSKTKPRLAIAKASHSPHSLALYRALRNTRDTQHPISLQIYLPSCQTPCSCCTTTTPRVASLASSHDYLQALKNELTLIASQLSQHNVIKQLEIHGSSHFLSLAQLGELMGFIEQKLCLQADFFNDYHITLDPARYDWGDISKLHQIGFNHVTFGINLNDHSGLNPLRHVRRLIEAARTFQFRSIGCQIFYPQHASKLANWQPLLDELSWLMPDRLQFIAQTATANAELSISPYLSGALSTFTTADYTHLGNGQFSLGDDDLTIAYEEGFLAHAEQGYTAHQKSYQIGVGVGAVTRIQQFEGANTSSMAHYLALSLTPQLSITRTQPLTSGEQYQADLQQAWLCQYQLALTALQHAFSPAQSTAFYQLMQHLTLLSEAQLVNLTDQRCTLTATGRLIALPLWQSIAAYLPVNTH